MSEYEQQLGDLKQKSEAARLEQSKAGKRAEAAEKKFTEARAQLIKSQEMIDQLKVGIGGLWPFHVSNETKNCLKILMLHANCCFCRTS